MTRVLVFLDADLASSMALRYACQLGKLTDMELQPIHVEDAAHRGGSPGSGWVRKTWESALLETGREEITRLVEAERKGCPSLLPPKLCMGDREEELLRELEVGDYDLFVEGALYRFTSADFAAKLRSRLYRFAPCPIILVRNLVEVGKVAFLLGEEPAPQALLKAYWPLLGQAGLEMDLFYYQQGHGLLGPGPEADPQKVLEAAREVLVQKGAQAGPGRVLEKSPERAAEVLRDYGLVVAAVSSRHRKGPLVKLLSQSPAPCMLLVLH